MAVDLPTTGDSKHSFWGTTGTTMSAQKISWSRKMLEFTFMVVVFRVTFRWVCLKIWGNTHSTGCIWMHHDASWCIIIFPMKNDKICFFYFQVPAPNTTSSWLHIYIYTYVYIYTHMCIPSYIPMNVSWNPHVDRLNSIFRYSQIFPAGYLQCQAALPGLGVLGGTGPGASLHRAADGGHQQRGYGRRLVTARGLRPTNPRVRGEYPLAN